MFLYKKEKNNLISKLDLLDNKYEIILKLCKKLKKTKL